MGASVWIYTVPYTPDIEAAYHQARQRAFETQDYFKWWEVAPHDERPDPFPTTIAALVELAGLTGTHSILDYPEDLHPSPWSASNLELVFGTTTPADAMIEQALETEHFWCHADGDYLIAYVDDQPTTVYFTGATGD
jgi:hypothetical protein